MDGPTSHRAPAPRPSRLAVYACPCCGGSQTVPLRVGERPVARRACPNGGCWACLGACRGVASRTEVLRLRAEGSSRAAPEMEVPIGENGPAARRHGGLGLGLAA